MDAAEKIVRATPIMLDPKIATGEAFRIIATACHAHIASNVHLLSPDLPDAVHQMRVGIRRLRSAILLFKPYLWPKKYKHLDGRLRALGVALGPSRDWDVFGHETLPKIHRHFPKFADFDHLCQSAETQRLATYDRLNQEQLEEWFQVSISDLLGGDELAVSIEEIAPELLDRMLHRVRRRSRHLTTPEDWHAFRKAVKKLRYSAEFFAPLYDNRTVRTYVDRCKDVQGVLGKVNDTSTMVRLLEELSANGNVLDWARRQEIKAAEHVKDAGTIFRTTKPFWH